MSGTQRRAQYRRDQDLERARAREREAVIGRMRERQTRRVKELSEAAQAYQRFITLQAFGRALRTTATQMTLDSRRKRWLRWAELQIAQADPVLVLLAPKHGGTQNVVSTDADLVAGVEDHYVDQLDD